MKRWIVNPRTHEVCESYDFWLSEGEFIFDAPTSADAAMAGRRHNLAVEALESLPGDMGMSEWLADFVVLTDKIEWERSDTSGALGKLAELHNMLEPLGFEVWREGLALLVLARRAPVEEDSGSAWVSEIGSDR